MPSLVAGFTLSFSNHFLVVAIGVDRCLAVFTPLSYRVHSGQLWRPAAKVVVVCVLSVSCALFMFLGRPVTGPCFPQIVTSEAGVLVWGLVCSAAAATCASLYAAIAARLRCRRSRRVASAAQPPGQEAGARDSRVVRRVTLQSLALALCVCAVYLPQALYLLLVVATGADRWAELGTTRMMVLNASAFVATLVDPLVLLAVLGAPRALVRAALARLKN